MSIEWQIIFLAAIAAAAYFSYKSGFDHGHDHGVNATLDTLQSHGLIDIEEVDEQ